MPRTYMRLAAVLAAGGVAVAACSSVQLGAAAIVGGQKITTAQLSSEVASYDAAYQSYSGKQFPASQTPQQILGWLVSFQVANRMAQRYGITVTPAEQAAARSGVMAQVRQEQPTMTMGELAAAIGLAPDMISSFDRFEAIQNAVSDRLDGGKAPASGSAAQSRLASTFAAAQCRAAKSLGIRVNPQFGAVNYDLNAYGAYSVIPVSSTLSKAEPSSSPASSGSAQASGTALTPPC